VGRNRFGSPPELILTELMLRVFSITVAFAAVPLLMRGESPTRREKLQGRLAATPLFCILDCCAKT